MKVKFTMREKLHANIEFEIECESQEQVEDALDYIGEYKSGDLIALELGHIFGPGNVKADGVNGIDNIEPDDECEFGNWSEA